MLVDGAFTDISEGHKMHRMVIGFGLGASVLHTNVEVYQRTAQGSRQVLLFTTLADSGKMPRAGITGPVGVAAGAKTAAVVGTNVAGGVVKSYTSAIEFLADKTAAEIVGQVTEYYAQQGWAS